MLIRPINNKAEANIGIRLQGSQHKKTAKIGITNPMICDSFTKQVSFKAAIHDYAIKGDWEGIKSELAKGIDVNIENDENRTALELAGKNGYLNIVEELLKLPNIKIPKAPYEIDVLKLAGCAGFPEIVEKILMYKYPNVNAKDNHGCTELINRALCAKSHDIAEILRHPDIDVNAKNNYGLTAFHFRDLNEDLILHPDLDLDEEMRMIKKQYGDSVTSGEKYINECKERFAQGKPILRKMTQTFGYNLKYDENIYTPEEITAEFINCLDRNDTEGVTSLLHKTPFINLTGNDEAVLKEICSKKNPSLVAEAFDYIKKQDNMKAEYEEKRKAFLETIPTCEISKLPPVAWRSVDGIRAFLYHPDFNPNQMFDYGITVFETACRLDPEGDLPREILSRFDNVYTKVARKTRYEKIKKLIDEYEKTEKYKVRLDNIKKRFVLTKDKKAVITDFKNFINSKDFKPEMTDSMGNSALHIISTIADDSARGLIEKLIRKGVDINAKNITNQNPIMSAIRAFMVAKDYDTKERLLSNIKFLLDKGSDIENQDKNGQTVLHYVCATTSIALLTMILKKKPNIFIEDLKGKRPHTYLKTSEMKEIYREYINK